MLTLEKMKQIDPGLATLGDEQLLELRDTLYGFAQLGFEAYYEKKHGSKCPVGLFPVADARGTI